MPLHVAKWERRDNTDRDALGNAALTVCRSARGVDGVRNARFYWANPDTVAIMVDAEPGSWGPGSGSGPTPDGAKAMFGLSDLARMTSSETWGEARTGEEAYRMSR